MRPSFPRRRAAWLAAGLACGFVAVHEARAGANGPDGPASAETKAPAVRPIDFTREIRPILTEKCLACHGPDAESRKAGMRLDIKDGAFGTLKNGDRPIVPGKPDESELVFRIESDDVETRMPPKRSRKSLTDDQIALLRRWVEQGAPWAGHWSFEPPKKLAPPPVKNARWPANAIDRFLLARMEAEGLGPEAPADKATLLRRVSIDLTGLPPTPEEVDAFLKDPSDSAYERVVDRLLESPRYGEHRARFWLDAARYGDTHGLHLDNYREIWPYRDWVIRAFNNNMPFDRFITEQLAGDLLPNPTLDQLVATGFNRCHISTSEGGSIEEEVYVRNVVDQVDTNGTVFLGLSTGCCRCHDHKFDPILAKDYYQFFAFFNNIDGPALDGNSAKWQPIVSVATPQQRHELADLDQKIASLRQSMNDAIASAAAAYVPSAAELEDENQNHPAAEKRALADFVWVDDALPPGASREGNSPWEFVGGEKHPVHSGQRSVWGKGAGLTQRVFLTRGEKLRAAAGDVLFAHVYIDKKKPPREIMLQWHTAGNWTHRAYWGENLIGFGAEGAPERLHMGDLPQAGAWARLEVPIDRLRMAPGTVIDGWAFTQHDGTVYWDQAGIQTSAPQDGQHFDTFAAWSTAQRASGGAGLEGPLKTALLVEPAKRTKEQTRALLDHFLAHAYTGTEKAAAPWRARLAEAEARKKAIEDASPTTLVFRERAGEPRPAFILKRGEYDQRGEKVGRDVPGFLPPLPPDAPRNRLGLAQWLVSPDQPLTARVTVNRFWLQVFGTGLVKTAEDFGAQGEPPSHPELLDWLAVEFRENGWNVKRFMKRLVMSSAYRQSSRVAPEKYNKDPDNRLLARGPRHRLDAETLRDQALFVSGLLYEHQGGPSVKPPQPAGLWEAVGYTRSNTANFVADEGAQKVHRRSLYTFWKRTSAPPQMTTFDAPSRESCTVRRERTNTPMQALLMLNEPQMIEAARALAERARAERGPDARARLTRMFRLAAGHSPGPRALAELESALADAIKHYNDHPDDARRLISIGETRPGPDVKPSELAAWTMIGNIILNLDEVITKG